MVLYGFVWFCMVYYGHVRPSEIGIATKKNPFGHQMVSMKNKSTTQEEIGPKDSEDTIFEAYLHEDLKYLEIPGGVE